MPLSGIPSSRRPLLLWQLATPMAGGADGACPCITAGDGAGFTAGDGAGFRAGDGACCMAGDEVGVGATTAMLSAPRTQ